MPPASAPGFAFISKSASQWAAALLRRTTDGSDRVRIRGVRGSAPPDTLKVCLNFLGGFRNQMELVLTGLDIDNRRVANDEVDRLSLAARQKQ